MNVTTRLADKHWRVAVTVTDWTLTIGAIQKVLVVCAWLESEHRATCKASQVYLGAVSLSSALVSLFNFK